MRRYCLSVVLFLGPLAPSFNLSTAADLPPQDPSDVPLAPAAVRQAMQDRDFPAARKAIHQATKTKDSPDDYLAYLQAWSLVLEKQHDRAIAALEKFEKDFPQSSWLRRARFAKAQAMVARGDFGGAQAIYEQEAKYLLSASRRQQSAAVYREFADASFQPPCQPGVPGARQQPDYKGARQFYTLALDAGLELQQRAEVEFRVGYCLQNLGDPADAAKAYQKWIEAHADNSRQMEARYRLGECLLIAGNLPEARKAWRELAKMATALPVGPKASAEQEWPAEAAFHLAETLALSSAPQQRRPSPRCCRDRRFHQAVPQTQVGGSGLVGNRSEPAPFGLQRRGRGHAPAFPARRPLERRHRATSGPLGIGPDLPASEEIRRGPRRVA